MVLKAANEDREHIWRAMVKGKGLGAKGNSEQVHSCFCQRRQSQAHDHQVFTKGLGEKNNTQGLQPLF